MKAEAGYPFVDAFSISPEWVQQVLTQQLYHADGPNLVAGDSLFLVDQFLHRAEALPHAQANQRAYALIHILFSLITAELNRQRWLRNLPVIDSNETALQARDMMTLEAACGSRELVCWSFLYYRYVRYDLDLPLVVFRSQLAVNERTLRRYENHAIQRLTAHLIQSEEQSRRQHKQQWLTHQLPSSVPVRLFGRDADLEHLEQVLAEGMPRHILVTGETGIGKTTLVQEVLRRAIQTMSLDHLIWIKHPTSIDAIHNQLQRVRLRPYPQSTVVVLDAAEQILQQPVTLQALLHDLSEVVVCLTSQDLCKLPDVLHYPLPEISRADALEMAYFTAKRHFAHMDDLLLDDVTSTYEEVGGNPEQIRQFILHISLEI